MRLSEQMSVVVLAALSALLLASSNVGQGAGLPLLGVYLYWLIRVAIEAGLFILIRDALGAYLSAMRPAWLVLVAATLVSLVPFVLAITAIDIALGYPELGLEGPKSASDSRVAELGLEFIYLLDNHVFLCMLLSVPQMMYWSRDATQANVLTSRGAPDDADATSENVALLAHQQGVLAGVEPPLKGALLWAEAQEHYVRLTTDSEARMVLQRFSDILRDLPDEMGVQVHRSHWVAYVAINEAFIEGSNLRLRLKTGSVVPVSRSFRAQTERALKLASIEPGR